MKKILSLLLIVALVFSMTACGGEDNSSSPGSSPGSKDTEVQSPDGSKKGDTLIIRATGDPMSFNPTITSDDNLYPAAQNMFNRLTKLDASKSPIPDAAESWDVSDDALKITWHLKDNMKWWDGEALDAEDVKYTFDYIKDNPTCYFSSSMNIVDNIEIVDHLTVVFNMNQADMSFIARIGWYGTFILPEHIFNNGQKWEDNPASKIPVGSGPFKFEGYEQGSSITLVANPDYHDGAPLIDKLIFSIIPDDATAMQALLNGEVDFCETIPSAYVDDFLANPDLRMVLDEYPSPYRIIFNVNNEILSDLAVRKAIALCINREEISEKAYGGVMPPEYSAYPSIVSWVANTEDTYPEQDIDAAIKVLEEAGYKKDADGYYVRGIEWEVFEGMQDMANLVIASCKQAGIELILNLSEYNAWAQKVGTDGKFMMESQGGFMGPDPAALATRYGTGSNSNYSGYSNSEFDELCKLAAQEPDQARRAEFYKKAQKLLVEDLPVINVVGYASYQGMSSKLHDMPIDGTGKWGWAEYSKAYFD